MTRIELKVTTAEGHIASLVLDVSKQAYAYAEQVLIGSIKDIFREEANNLPHAAKVAPVPPRGEEA